MRQAHCDGHFSCDWIRHAGGFRGGEQQDKACKILRVVLNAFGKDHSVVTLGGAAAGNRRVRFITPAERFAYASGSVLGRDPFPL